MVDSITSFFCPINVFLSSMVHNLTSEFEPQQNGVLQHGKLDKCGAYVKPDIQSGRGSGLKSNMANMADMN